MTWRLVSRASRLALAQVDEALAALATSRPEGVHDRFVTKTLDSFGDKNKSLSLLGGEVPADVFTRELDVELLEGRADFAVHSAKDLPSPLPAGLVLAALLPAADQSDALACRAGLGPRLADLAPGSRVGTSSPLRQQELRSLRPDLEVVSIRGTIEERLGQVDRGNYDAVVMATCALRRLGLEHRIGEILPFATHPLQGHLAVTCAVHRADVRQLWTPIDVRRAWGSVALVGAGPGDPGMITVRGAELLARADVVFTDSLANPDLLDGLAAEIRWVGKRGDAGGEQQDRINAALVEAARAGRRVVRLKGGDPMVFGRGTEEREYVEQRLIEVEVVPGITAAVAAASTTAIPLTERGVSNSVSLCLGAPEDRIPVPDAETLVYYMASATLAAIVTKLKGAGRPADTPVAVVRNASLPDQKVWTTTLGDLGDELARQPSHPYGSPLLVFVGPVVRPDRVTSWFDRQPRVWYTGTGPVPGVRSSRMVHRPLIRIEPLQDWRELDANLDTLRSYRWAVFTSRHTVDAVFGRMAERGFDTRRWAGLLVAAVGKTTAAALETRGLRADLVPSVESAAGLVAEWSEHRKLSRGDRVWSPGSDLALPTLQTGLTGLGAEVVRTVVYRNVPVETAPEVDLDALDQIIVTSPSTARALARWFPSLPPRLVLVPRGDETARALAELYPQHLNVSAGGNRPWT